jgi:hypothetical protein
MNDGAINSVLHEINTFFGMPNAFRSILILFISIVVAYWLSHFVALFIVRIAKSIAFRSDSTTDDTKRLKLRRIETHLSVAVAVVRALIVGIVAFYVWQVVSPAASFTTAAIGASAFFIVIASATLGMVLRDITAGATMIIERWFDVGDFIRIEPFWDVSGVVERITLRSTKLRNLNGEVIWIHNQHMHGAKVTPRGLRTIAVDVFMNNEKVGTSLIEKVIATIPLGPLTVTESIKITRKERWGDYLWLFTIVGQTPPGREWLMEDYFVESLKEIDAKRRGTNTLVRKPLVRFADPVAERSYRRAVRVKKQYTAD